MTSLLSKSQKPAHSYSWSLCEEEEEKTHEALPNTRTLVKAAQKLHTKGCILLLLLLLPLLLLLGFTKCVNQHAPAKNLAKDKSFQAKEKRVSFTNPSILSCGWVDATVAAYLDSGCVGGWIFFLNFFFFKFYLYLLNVCWNVWWNVLLLAAEIGTPKANLAQNKRSMMGICLSL